jgi:class 3 adenylate cyclase/tetratricopeptide (TPR) repeat protein
MKKSIYLILTFCILHSSFCIAQKQGQAKIDSLLLELPKAKLDTNKVNLLVVLSLEYYDINPDEGIKYGEMGLQLSEKLLWKNGIAKIANSIGICNWAKSNYPKALEYYNKALKINEEIKDKSGIAKNLGNIGLIYNEQSDFPKALEYYFKSLKIMEVLNNKTYIAGNLGNIGTIYNKQSDYPKALEYYFKALKINEELNNKTYIAGNLGNIGVIYNKQSDYPKALEYFFKALKIDEELNGKISIGQDLGNIGLAYMYQSNYSKALDYYFKALKINEELNNKIEIALNLGNIGIIYIDQYNYPKALEYYFKALKINEDINNKFGIALNLGNIGELYVKLSQDSIFDKLTEKNEFVGLTKELNLRKGIEYLLKAMDISKEVGNLNYLIFWYKCLYDGYKLQGNYSKALEYHELFKKTQDSVFNMEKSKKFATLEAIRDKELAEKQIIIQKLELEKQKSRLLLMLIGIGSMFIIIFGLGFLLFQLKKQKKLSDWLLHNILPKSIAERLMKKEHPIADSFDSASVIFIDIVDFTKTSAGATAKRVTEVLNILYSKLDQIAKKHGLEKIKTIGDCYMAAAGIPISDPENATKAAQFTLEAMNLLKDYDTGDGTILNFRCGVDCGSVVAGVIGEHKFIYDLWGDTVNTASRMESNGVAGKIQVSERFKEKITNNEQGISNIEFEERGMIEIKGKGTMRTYFLENKI